MLKKSIKKIAFVFLGIALCFSFAQLSHANTVVYFEANGALSDVASFQFEILTPVAARVTNFTATQVTLLTLLAPTKLYRCLQVQSGPLIKMLH